MQVNRVNKSTRGGGIYEKCDIDVEQTQCNNNYYDANHNPLSPSKSLWNESSLNENKFDVILNALDQQVETLNQLRRPSVQQTNSPLGNHQSASNNHLSPLVKNPKQTHHEHLNPSISDRESFLQDYVRTNISEDKNCSCHFHFASNELKLLNELNECYRKFCQFNSDQLSASGASPKHREATEQQTATQQVIEEASNFIGCEREIRGSVAKCGGNHSCFSGALHKNDDTEQPRSPDLQQRRPSSKARGSNEPFLFIDAGRLQPNWDKHPQQSGASGHRRRKVAQLAYAKSDSELHYSSGDCVAERGEPLVSREACSESALYDNPAESSVELHPLRRLTSTEASIFDSDPAHESSYSKGDESQSSANLSGPEYEQRSALIGIEESPICEPNCAQRSRNECKRKHRSPRSPAKPYRQRTSSSSLDESFFSDYQLGCSLTYESVGSPSPRQCSPFDRAPTYYVASSDDFDSTTASNCTRATDHDHYTTLESRSRYQGPEQVGRGPSEAVADLLFIPAENYHSIESCASYEIEESGTSPQPWVELLDERRASASSRAHRRGNRRRRRLRLCKRRNRRSSLNVCVHLEPSSSPPLSYSSTSSIPETMESDWPPNHYHANDSAHNLREAGGLSPRPAYNCSPSARSNESLDAKLKLDTSKSPTISHHDDARGLRLGTNAKTRLQQQGVNIQHEHLRLRGSSESSRCAPISANMKAAKDIAKVSAPALASLQYLPGQVDVRGSRSIDRFATNRRASSPQKAGQVRRSISMTQQIEAPTRGGLISGYTRPAPRLRDDESSKHDDSCLFHRLCLCNCLQRNRSNTVKKLKNRSLTDEQTGDGAKISPSHSSQSAPSGRWCARERDHNKAQPPNGPASVNSSLNGKESTSLDMRDVSQGSRLRVSANRLVHDEELRTCEHEKQSPSFMNLLKSRQQHAQLDSELENALNCKTKKHVDSQVVAQREKQPHRGAVCALATPARINSNTFGCIGDLTASAGSSASDSHMSERSSPTDFTKSNSSKAKPSSKSARDDSYHLEVVAANIQTGTKSPTLCTGPKQKNHHSKRLASYKKLLSPRKLFSSSGSSVCDCCEKQNQEQPSFFSRSLNRLGARKPRSGSSSSQRDQPAEGVWPRSASCTSPTVSLSNSQPDTYSDSINSLDEINLTHSLPFSVNEEVLGGNYYNNNAARLERVPDIVLSRVEYQEADCASSRSMTRSPSSYQHQRPSSSQSLRNDDHVLTRHQSQRHGSELSFNLANTSSAFHESRRPFSLPGSPNSRRRNRNRSSRLSQSPVSFQSPANESTKIEDGLKVCSTEHFEKHIGNIKDDQIEAQKRLFTAWINHFAPNLIRHDLIVELQDGIKLIGLLATLTHDKQLLSQYERLNRDKQSYINRLVLTPSSRLKHLSNVSIAIDYLRRNQGMKLVNLNPMDIVSGKANVILGLCWSIILNFQFDNNFLKGSDSSSNHSSTTCQSTSRLSTSHTNEDRARAHNKRVEEFTTKDIANARNRILVHINKRFNLKLTNLTSSLIDGNVLLAIIKQLLPTEAQIDFEGFGSHAWNNFSDEQKLDYSFELAKDYLNVPKLISAAHLRQQTIGENNPKPLLIYLSMLLKADARNCSTDQILELRQLDECLKKVPEDQQLTQATPLEPGERDINSMLKLRLDDLDTIDKFQIEKLQTTLSKIKEIDSIFEAEHGAESKQIDKHLIDRHFRLKRQAEQVELLIDWINRASQLFETTPRSSADLALTINEYQRFFSRKHLPKVDTTLCPTLEKQYRECLATAKQRVMSLEQTMKNWLNYDQASHELKKWLVTAEAKLNDALRPCNSHDGSTRSLQSANPLDLHMSRLDDLVQYFELEPVDMGDFDNYINSFSSSTDGLSPSSLNLDQSTRSLSGSLISLGSTGSRLSTLTSSKKASYHRLFDDFELKGRLLAAMLESEQRDKLLSNLTEFKSKLKYITEYKVPQVIGEIRISINRCEMSIQEQDECCSGAEDQIDESGLYSAQTQLTSRDGTSPGTDLISDDAHPSSDKVEETFTRQEVRNGSDFKITAGKQKRNKTSDNGKLQSKKAKPVKKNPIVKRANLLVRTKASPDDDKDLPYVKRFWNKLVRASKMSLSFNIVLLICLAGICVVPLIQRDACCELSQSFIPNGQVTVNQKPT